MLSVSADLAIYMAYAGGAVTFCLGLVFLISPARGLDITRHTADKLPLIMAGRYMFMTMMAVAAGIAGQSQTIALVFIGLAGVAFFDTLVYAQAKRAVMPHFLAGIGALLVVCAAFWGHNG